MLLVKVAVHSNATLPILFVFLFLYCNYICQGGYVLLGICLFVCLSVSSLT